MIANKTFKRTEAEFLMMLVALIWGVTFVLVKNALADIGPFLFLGIRFVLAFLVLAIFSFKNIIKVEVSTVAAGCLLGFFLFIGYVFQTVGLQYTTSSNAGFITGVSVVLVPIMFYIKKRTWPDWQTTLTVVMAATGLFLLSVPAGKFALGYGDLLVLVCAFGFALHIVFVSKYSWRHNAVAITGVQILFVGLLCLVIGLAAEPIPQHMGSDTILAIIVTSVFATSLAFLLQNYLQRFSTPTRFAVVLTTEPVFAALAGFVWANEILTVRAYTGAALILLAMLLSILLRKN
ncbi:MAG: DMT family transporter [Syntrophomonadaceae bacterium]|nr:DMT family transporter [Syntrophomonadaceae bacterium]